MTDERTSAVSKDSSVLDREHAPMQGWFGLLLTFLLLVMIAVSVWSLLALPAGTCVTMQWGLDGSPGWCASKPLAALLLPSLAILYGVRLYFSFPADEDSVGALLARLSGPVVIVGTHVFLLVKAA